MGNADGLLEIDEGTVGLEIKSMNDAKHKEFVRKGIKGSHPQYYDQMQFMMGFVWHREVRDCLLQQEHIRLSSRIYRVRRLQICFLND